MITKTNQKSIIQVKELKSYKGDRKALALPEDFLLRLIEVDQ